MNHGDEVYGVAVTPDGRWGLTACRDGYVRIWDLHLAKQVGPPIAAVTQPEVRFAFNIAITPDGRRAVVGTNDPSLLSLDLSDLDADDGLSVDDLAYPAEVASGLHVDAGNLSNLTTEEWVERWRDLRRRPPVPLGPGGTRPSPTPSASAPACRATTTLRPSTP